MWSHFCAVTSVAEGIGITVKGERKLSIEENFQRLKYGENFVPS